MKKKKRERKKEFRGKGGKGKKKNLLLALTGQVSSAGVLSVQREGVVGRIGFTFLPSWVTLFAVVQPAVQFLMDLLLPSRPLVHQLCCP